MFGDTTEFVYTVGYILQNGTNKIMKSTDKVNLLIKNRKLFNVLKLMYSHFNVKSFKDITC